MRSAQVVGLLLILVAISQVLSTRKDRLDLSLGPPGSGPNSRESSPSASGRGKTPVDDTSSLKLFGVNLKQTPSKSSSLAYPSQSSAQTHTDPARLSQSIAAHAHTAHLDSHAHGKQPAQSAVAPRFKQKTAGKLSQGVKKPIKKGQWWRHAGGRPYVQYGTSPNCEKQREYRETKKLKLQAQAQQREKHPFSHDHLPPKGGGRPGSPGAGAGSALVPRGLPGSRSPSPSSPRGKSPAPLHAHPSHARHTRPVKLFGVNINTSPDQSVSSEPSSQVKQAHSAQASQTMQAHARPTHSDSNSKQSGTALHPAGSTAKSPTLGNPPEATKKRKSHGHWWSRPGGRPPKKYGSAPRYLEDKTYREKKQEKLQAKHVAEHPSGHGHWPPKGGPGSPPGGDGAGSALVRRGSSGSRTPSPSGPGGKSHDPAHHSRPVKLFGVNINQAPGRSHSSGHSSPATHAHDQSTHPVALLQEQHKRPPGWQKGKARGHWWQRAGTGPPKRFGTGPHYEVGKKYREKKKLKLETQNLEQHPSGHPSPKAGGPSSPGNGAGSAVVRRGSSGSRSPSPSSPRSKAVSPQRRPVKLFGVDINQAPDRASSSGHPSLKKQGHDQSTHPDTRVHSKNSGDVSRPVSPLREKLSAPKRRPGGQKGQPKGQWWKKPGARPPAPPGTGSRYEVQRNYIERKKMKLQGKHVDEHPSGHSRPPPKEGPGSPEAGAGNALVPRGSSSSKSPSPSSPRSKAVSPQRRPVKLFGVNINQPPGRPASPGHLSQTMQSGDHLSHPDPKSDEKHGKRPVGGSSLKMPSDKRKERKVVPWWNQAGGKPRRQYGTSPRWLEGKIYREKEKQKLQEKHTDEHPSGHGHPPPGGGPGSPGADAGSALVRRASSGSKSPSSSSPPGESVNPRTQPVKLFGVNINQPPGRPASPGNLSRVMHTQVAHSNQAVQSGDHSAQLDPKLKSKHDKRPVGKSSLKVPLGGLKGKKKGPWWKQAGGRPLRALGTSPRYLQGKRYREKQKQKLQGKHVEELPSGHGHPRPGGGPGSPGGGDGAGSALVSRSGSKSGSPSPSRSGSRGESPTHGTHSTKLFGVTVQQSSKGKAPAKDAHSTKVFGVDLGHESETKAAQVPQSVRLFGVDLKQPGSPAHPSPSTHSRPGHRSASDPHPKGRQPEQLKGPESGTLSTSDSRKRPAASASQPKRQRKAAAAWWKKPGGLPMGLRPKGPRYEVSKRYREKKKEKLLKAQAEAQNAGEHPSDRRPGSPGAGAGSGLARRGQGSGSRSPSPSKSTDHSGFSGLLGDIVRQGTRRPAASHEGQSTHTHATHVTQATQTHKAASFMQTAHGHPIHQGSGSKTDSKGQEAGRLGHLVAGMRPKNKRPPENKLPEGVKKPRPSAQWWKRPGGVPPNQAGKSPQAAAQRRYREKQKLLKQQTDEHPSKHQEHPPKGPGSPGAGSHAVGKKRS